MNDESQLQTEIERFEQAYDGFSRVFNAAHDTPRDNLVKLERMLGRCRKVIELLHLALGDTEKRERHLEAAKRAKVEFFGDLDFPERPHAEG